MNESRSRPLRSQLKYTTLTKLFPSSIDNPTNAQIARLCVLFEDLRIEITGFTLSASDIEGAGPNVSAFDISGNKARALYFLRRSIATCFEFAEAVRLLDESSFQTIMSSFPVEEQNNWREAVLYFKNTERKFWKLIRNDVGGHFGTTAALFALESFLPGEDVTIEIRQVSSKGCTAILGFASEVAATALLRHLPGDTPDQKLKKLFEAVQMAYPLAIKAVEFIVGNHLWQRAR